MSDAKVTYEDIEAMLTACELEAAAWQKEFLVRMLNSKGPLTLPVRYK